MNNKKFEIRAPKMPTLEEHRAVSLKWLERIRATLIDQWPEDLLKLSYPTEFVEVPSELIGEFFDRMDGKPIGPATKELATELDSRMGWERKFIRLNSRSPKDSAYPFEVPATMSGKEALHLLGGSMRILDDLYEFKWVPEQKAYVCLREFQWGLRPADEYRCFVKDRKLIAVTAYDYTEGADKPAVPPDGGKAIRETINAYFDNILSPTLHLDTVVFDVWMMPRKGPQLIEINPYGLSDPCFFGDYEGVENARGYIQYSFEGGDNRLNTKG